MRGDGWNRWPLQIGASAALVAVLLVLGDASAGASSGVAVKEPQYGFSLTLPVDWKQVPLNGNDVTALLNAETHDDPALTNALNSEIASEAAAGMKVFAIGPVAGSTVPNLNVIVTSSAGVPTGSAFAQVAVAEAKIELTQVGASHLKTSIVENRLGTSARATYELNLKNTAPEFGVQFYVQHKSYMEIVTVTTSNPASSQSAARLIVHSWRW